MGSQERASSVSSAGISSAPVNYRGALKKVWAHPWAISKWTVSN